MPITPVDVWRGEARRSDGETRVGHHGPPVLLGVSFATALPRV